MRNLAVMTTSLSVGRIPEWTVADRLRKAREDAGLEQQELAAMIGVARNTVGNAEKGKTAVRKIVLNQWSLATGVPVQWLETGKAPHSDDPNEGLDTSVRHQGLEPRTRWF